MKTADIKDVLKKLTGSLLSISFLLSLSSFHISSVYAGEFVWGGSGKPFTYFQKNDLQINTVGRGDENIKIKKISYEFKKSDWFENIHLSFDEQDRLDYLKRRFENTHRLLKASYKTRYYPDSVRSSASFESPGHQIWLIPPKYSFLSQTKHLGDFSILFLIKPHTGNKNMNVFYKTGFFEGRKHGISCLFQERHLVFQFYNLFWLSDSSLPLFEIKTKEQLTVSGFHKVLLQYEESKGRLRLFLDSIEQKVVYLTKTGKPGGDRYIARFHPWDKSPLIIGKNFLGALDEMIFSNRLLPSPYSPHNDTFSYGATQKIGSRFYQKSGSLTSKVYQIPYSNSTISQFDYVVNEPPGSDIRFYVRFADQPFLPDAPEFQNPFREIQPQESRESTSFVTEIGQKNINTSFYSFKERNLGKGKYFQWKAVFYPDPLGKHTPVLDRVRLIFQENPPPSPPQNLEVVSSERGRVTLRFSRNSELDVLQGGRYHLYYGIKPDEALGVIRYQRVNASEKVTISDKDQLMTDDLRYQNRIQITVDNQMIYENLVYTKTKPYFNYEYPLLQKGISYYFWVTACDNAYNESIESFDHESKPSHYVTTRIR